jgi:hypothetical protein
MLPATNRRLTGDNRCSGQILAEVCIGFALLTFTWILMSFSLFMFNNRIRTAMAARHAAWMIGTKPGLSCSDITSDIDQDFFYQNNNSGTPLVTVEPAPAVASSTGFSLGSILSNVINGGQPPNRVTVRFGVGSGGAGNTNVYPFTLMNVKVPFMPKSSLENLYSVESQCQWAAVGDTWTDKLNLNSLLSGALLGIVGALSDIYNAADQLFQWLEDLATLGGIL